MDTCFALNYGGAKRGQVCVGKIVRRHRHVHLVTQHFWATMNRKVLRRRHRLEVLRIVALHARDKQPRPFVPSKTGPRRRSPASSPARNAKDINVRRTRTSVLRSYCSPLAVRDVRRCIFCPCPVRKTFANTVLQVTCPRSRPDRWPAEKPSHSLPAPHHAGLSFHQLYAGIPRRSIAGAAFPICEAFSSSVKRRTRSSTRLLIGRRTFRYGGWSEVVPPGTEFLFD